MTNEDRALRVMLNAERMDCDILEGLKIAMVDEFISVEQQTRLEILNWMQSNIGDYITKTGKLSVKYFDDIMKLKLNKMSL